MKHNKKRNTAILYESLITMMTHSVLEEDNETRDEILSIIKEFFRKGKILKQELEIYKEVYDSEIDDEGLLREILAECKELYSQLDKRSIFNEQTQLILRINKAFDGRALNTFIPNYRSLASLQQIFNKDASVKKRILLEKKLLKELTASKPIEEDMEEVDDLVFEIFLKKFNEKYSNKLLPEQKELLYNFTNNDEAEFAFYLNEEIGTLKKNLLYFKENLPTDDRLTRVLKLFEEFGKEGISDEGILKILKIQELVKVLRENPDANQIK